MINDYSPSLDIFFHCLSLSLGRALHWVTPQMLCVPVNEEIPEVSEMVVKAITGQ